MVLVEMKNIIVLSVQTIGITCVYAMIDGFQHQGGYLTHPLPGNHVSIQERYTHKSIGIDLNEIILKIAIWSPIIYLSLSTYTPRKSNMCSIFVLENDVRVF